MPSKPRKLSSQMLRVLGSLANGKPPLRKIDDTAVVWLCCRGLITTEYQLTLAGELVLAEARIAWRDSLLTKYEARIRELEQTLRLVQWQIAHSECRRIVREVLERRLPATPAKP